MNKTSPQCPACQRALREVRHRNVLVDVCDCGGFWFDAGEVETWARTPGQRTRSPLAGKATRLGPALLRCPRCQQDRLASFAAPALQFAKCNQCHGVWLGAEVMARLDPLSPGSSGSDAIPWVLEVVVALLQIPF